MTITKNTRLLVISPHPDDEALGVGGLIGKCKKERATIFILYMSVGSSRQLVTSQTKQDTRMQEIDEVKKLTNAQIAIAFLGDAFTRLDTLAQKDLIEKIEDTIESFKPTLVVIPSASSYNQDHRAVFDACMTALRPVPKSVRHFVPHVLEYFEPYIWSTREPKQPNVYLDLSEQYKGASLLDYKITLYKCHATQVREDPFPRSPENLIRLAHIYGKEIGVSIAEAYHLIRAEL